MHLRCATHTLARLGALSTQVPTPGPHAPTHVWELLNSSGRHNPTGLPRSQETPPPEDPTVALCLGTYGDPLGVGVSYERSTPAGCGTPTERETPM